MSERNFACPDYLACLDRAAAVLAEDFSCQDCPRRREVRPDWCEVQAADVDGIFDLWAAALNASGA